MEQMIRKKLKYELNYSDFSAARTSRDLVRIKHLDIKDALDKWIKRNAEPCVWESEYSTDMLTKNHNMTYPASLIFIDWLREDPITAKHSLQVRM